jgi:hypothetical protein
VTPVVLFLLLASADPDAPRFQVDQRVRVMELVRPDAEVCLVHMHGNELNARKVMMELKDIACANAVWLDDARHPPDEGMLWGDDRIPVPNATMAPGKCTVNPNRILTPQHFAVRIANDCEGDETARRALRTFLDARLLPALARCRAKGLPVVAFHNNTNLTNRDMDARLETTVKERKHDILFVTQRADYDRLAAMKRWSVSLQSMPPANDGSLSVLLKDERYINVEAQIAPENYAENRAMGEAALRVVGGWACGANDDAPMR